MANIKLALRYLWGDEEGDKDLQEGNLPITEFQSVLAAPPPWLAKALGKTAEERVRFMANEQHNSALLIKDS